MATKLKLIPSFPNYSITHDGRIYTNKTGRQRKLHSDKYTGYLTVGLYRDGQMHIVALHRLLLEVFMGPCPEGMQCRHLDGNKQNNNLCNLKWGTPFENTADRTVHGTHVGNYKLTVWCIIWIKYLLSLRKFTQREIASFFAIHESQISHIKYNRSWSGV